MKIEAGDTVCTKMVYTAKCYTRTPIKDLIGHFSYHLSKESSRLNNITQDDINKMIKKCKGNHKKAYERLVEGK
ncbi:MAG TPA: hypothetical protein PLE74_01145 [Candidatus Cloacimonadota bacterium]|nr:hypothetical protein [Candidatus Cloacimonadota bacterium]